MDPFELDISKYAENEETKQAKERKVQEIIYNEKIAPVQHEDGDEYYDSDSSTNSLDDVPVKDFFDDQQNKATRKEKVREIVPTLRSKRKRKRKWHASHDEQLSLNYLIMRFIFCSLSKFSTMRFLKSFQETMSGSRQVWNKGSTPLPDANKHTRKKLFTHSGCQLIGGGGPTFFESHILKIWFWRAP